MGRLMVLVLVGLVLSVGVANAEEMPAMDPEMQQMMEKMHRYGNPGKGHKALEAFVGSWKYTGAFQMAPDSPRETMSGTASNRLIFGGRFLQQEIVGEAMAEGMPPFEGLGITGYDNLRQQYQSVWFDSMGTGMMMADGQFDMAANALNEQGDFSCPMTGETHRTFRAAWRVIDSDHHVYESYMRTPEGGEYQAVEISYTRTQ